MNGTIKITTLGTSHGDPTYERFNTSTLVEIPGIGGFLVDAGAPVLGLLIRKRFPLENLKAVFITHMHQDHFGGIPDILKFWVKRLPPDKILKFYLPEPESMETIFAFTELAHRKIRRDMFDIQGIDPQTPIRFSGLEIEAVPTDHFSNEKLRYPSYALTFSAAGKKLLLTGDLSRDFHDFPKGIQADMVFCELTHYALENHLQTLAGEKFGKLVFTHIGDQWHGKEAQARFRQLVSALPYPTVMAHDGDAFEL